MVATVRFSGVPPIPQKGTPPDLVSILTALKENVELLTGSRGTNAEARRALIYEQVRDLTNPPEARLTDLSAQKLGIEVTIGGTRVTIPDYTQFTSLIDDVYNLAVDVAVLREILTQLLKALKNE